MNGIIERNVVYKTERGTPVTDSLKVAGVLFSQALETSQDSILIGELAKLICQNGVQMGEKRLFLWLRSNAYLCQQGERYNQPTQKALEIGLFELRKITINVGDRTKVRTTTKVTGKGQVYFVNKFLYNNQQQGI